MEIVSNNVNNALADCLRWLAVAGIEEPSRNGPVLVSPEPVLVTYTRPTERVLFSPLRDANPFFHLMEALWILAGRQDIAWPAYFNKNFTQYSDDGITQRGAYGARWRSWFGYDQLELLAEELRKNSTSRRCVLGMWDSTGLGQPSDLHAAMAGGKDVPCNTHAYFDLRGGRLNLTVCNRSNDLLWGLAGANAVHFSMLLEYMAAAVGAPVGVYRQFTNNLHLYTAVAGDRERVRQLATDAAAQNHYAAGEVSTTPLIQNFDAWRRELKQFMKEPNTVNWLYTEMFFREVAAPMYAAWKERKEAGLNGLRSVEKITAPDWRRACVEWIERRAPRKATQSA